MSESVKAEVSLLIPVYPLCPECGLMMAAVTPVHPGYGNPEKLRAYDARIAEHQKEVVQSGKNIYHCTGEQCVAIGTRYEVILPKWKARIIS